MIDAGMRVPGRVPSTMGRSVARAAGLPVLVLMLVGLAGAGDERGAAAEMDPSPAGGGVEGAAVLEGRVLGDVITADGRRLREVVVLEAFATHLRLRHSEGIARVGFGDLPAGVRGLVLDAFTASAVDRSEAGVGAFDASEVLAGWHPFLPDPVVLRPELPTSDTAATAENAAPPGAEDGGDPGRELAALRREIATIDARIQQLDAEAKAYRARHAAARARGRISAHVVEAVRRERWIATYRKQLRLLTIREGILAGLIEGSGDERETPNE